MEILDSLNKGVNTLEKVPNESFNTNLSHAIKVNSNKTSNTKQKQDKSVLMKQLKEWQSHQNNVIFIIFLRQTLPIVTTPQPFVIKLQAVNR